MYPRGVLSPEDPVKTMRFESASQAPGLTRHDATVLRHAGEDLIGDTGRLRGPARNRNDAAIAGFAIEWESAGGGGWHEGLRTQDDTIEDTFLAMRRRRIWSIGAQMVMIALLVGCALIGHPTQNDRTTRTGTTRTARTVRTLHRGHTTPCCRDTCRMPLNANFCTRFPS